MQIVTAWQCISPEVTMKSFKKCCTSTAVDETDDDMLWNGSEEDGYRILEHVYQETQCPLLCKTLDVI
jgi:hypothetical protein